MITSGISQPVSDIMDFNLPINFSLMMIYGTQLVPGSKTTHFFHFFRKKTQSLLLRLEISNWCASGFLIDLL